MTFYFVGLAFSHASDLTKASRSLQRVPAASTTNVAALRKLIDNELGAITEAGTYKHERIITSRQGAAISVQGGKGRILNFCANNYLGLSVS